MITLLTEREREVLVLASHGFSNKQIARRLACSDSAVSMHVYRLNRKIKARGRVHAVAIALRKGLIT